MSRGEDFWSRRRKAVAQEQADALEAEAAQAQSETLAALEEKTDEEILSDLNLPNPDTLQPGQDIQAFMAKAVPERIRKRALRQLWKLNPVLANLDGLVEYGEDYTDAATVIENLQTTYQVGKGMLAHIEEMARQAEAEAEAENADHAQEPEDIAADQDEPVEHIDAEENAANEVHEDIALQTKKAEPEAEDVTTMVVAAPKRMRFAFEE